jgi:hypothetical protein
MFIIGIFFLSIFSLIVFYNFYYKRRNLPPGKNADLILKYLNFRANAFAFGWEYFDNYSEKAGRRCIFAMEKGIWTNLYILAGGIGPFIRGEYYLILYFKGSCLCGRL